MNLHPIILIASLALLAGNVAASPSPAPANGLWPVPVHRIVGLWHANMTVAPCLGGPARTFFGMETFHAGGTMSNTNQHPGSSRGPGQGIWKYDGGRRYRFEYHFVRYLPDGSFDGLTEIHNDLVLNAAATTYNGTVYSRILNLDGSLRAEMCGTVAGVRNELD